jgi:hypothetical protein
MKLSVVVDQQGNIISVRKHTAHEPSKFCSQVRMRAPRAGRVLSLDAPAELKGKSLVEIHDSANVDLSGPSPVLRHKKS